MAAKAKEYEFPMLTEKDILTELAEILPPHSASQLSANDLKKPTAVKWQKFYVDILCVVFDLREEQLTMLTFNELSSLPNPELQSDFMVKLRLSKCMSRLLYTCRYTEFKLPDITKPDPTRLRRILSAIVNFCRHREEMITKSHEIEKEERDALSQCNNIKQKIEETRSWLNTKASEKVEKSKVVTEKKRLIGATEIEINALNESTAEINGEIQRLKLKASETQKSNANEKLRVANLGEEIENLNKNIVPSPQKLHGEIEEQKRKFEVCSTDLVHLQTNLEEANQIATQVKETKECLFRVTSPIRKIQQSVKICEEAESQVKQMNENINYKKDEYNANADKLQQLDRVEANKTERAMKMEMAHSNKFRSIDRERTEIEKEKALLEKKLEGSDAALLTSRAPLLEIQQKQYQEQKVFDDRMMTARQKFDKVRAGLRDFNEREIRRFDIGGED